MTDKEKTIKELKAALNSLDITNKYRLNLIRAIEYLQEEPVSEELEEAITSYADNHYMDFAEQGDEDYWKTYYAFKAGAKWQKEHQWISTKDRLPEEEFDDGYTFVFVNIKVDEETSRFDVDYIRDGKWELHPNSDITHWMPIPPLTKE